MLTLQKFLYEGDWKATLAATMMKFTIIPLLLFAIYPAWAEYHELEATDGRKISVKILSTDASGIRVERQDGHILRIENTLLSQPSLDLIRGLRIKREIESSRNFNILFSDKRIDKSDEKFDIHGLETSNFQKNISIRKSASIDIDGMELRYVMLIKRDASEQLPTLIHGIEKVHESVNNTELKYQSPVYSLRRMYLLPNHWWDRNKNEYTDKEEGIWARLYYKDQLIYEESAPRSFLKNKNWNEFMKLTGGPVDPIDPAGQFDPFNPTPP